EARVEQRLRLVDAPSHRRDDLVDDAQEMRLVLEADQRRLEDAGALDVDAFVAVDQNVVDGPILEQGLDGAEARHLVENFVDEVLELPRVEGQPYRRDI